MLQIGDVDFDTAAGDDYNFIFAGVAEPGRRRPHGRPGDRASASPEGLGDQAARAGAPATPGRRRLG